MLDRCRNGLDWPVLADTGRSALGVRRFRSERLTMGWEADIADHCLA